MTNSIYINPDGEWIQLDAHATIEREGDKITILYQTVEGHYESTVDAGDFFEAIDVLKANWILDDGD